MSELRDFCERLWNGEIDTINAAHPVTSPYGDRHGVEIDANTLYYKGFASATTIDTGDGLVMLDTGAQFDTGSLYESVRAWRRETRLAAAVFSHHHVDHIFGVAPFDTEAAERSQPRPLVYGHQHLARNFDRYKITTGWNGAINRRQFTAANLPVDRKIPWPEEYRYADIEYSDQITFREGALTFELHHARGETEDATWTWVPERKLLFPGDLFIWCVPNAGNPQKVQRYLSEWATALRTMAALGADLMVPGHGFPIWGADRISTALHDSADLLDSIEQQALAIMNTGASLDTVIHSVEISDEALQKPYLRPVYDHPQFLIRNVWRLYGGWYDGEPDNLLPSPRVEQAREWIDLAGGIDAVIARAASLRDAGNLRLASHLIEMAAHAQPDSSDAHEVRASIYDARANEEASSMARGIFNFAAASSRAGKRDGFQS